MTVKELVEKYSKNKNVSLSKVIEAKPYLPFSEKVSLVKRIVNNSATVENSVVQVNEIEQYIQFTVETIKAYTNIEFGEDYLSDYDQLCCSGLLGDVVATFDGEYNMILSLVEMEKRRVLSQNSTEVQIAKFLNSISEKADIVVNAIAGKIDNFDISDLNFSTDDVQKLTEFLGLMK